MIKDDVKKFFEQKLEEFNGNLESLLECEKTVNEIDDFLQKKEEEALKILKEKYKINFEEFDFNVKRDIILQVECSIFLNK